MIKHNENKLCSGCMACVRICPKECIKIDLSDKKRIIQQIDIQKCIKCNYCYMVCPHEGLSSVKKPIAGYSGVAKNRKTLHEASSGGIASLLYEYGLKHNISCVGVTFDGELRLKYKFIGNETDIHYAQGSKYAFSDMGKIYDDVVTRLVEQRVIFIGLPCHVEALKKYLEIKKANIQNLFTVDIVCHGVTAPLFFHKHIEFLLKRYGRIKDIRFREKDNQFGVTLCGDQKNIIAKRHRNEDEYMLLYLNGFYIETCYKCRFAKKNRVGDFTIKDCTGFGFKCLSGVHPIQSSILVNTPLGESFLEQIRHENTLYTYKCSAEKIIQADTMLQRPSILPTMYHTFYMLESLFGYRIAARILYGYHGFTD